MPCPTRIANRFVDPAFLALACVFLLVLAGCATPTTNPAPRDPDPAPATSPEAPEDCLVLELHAEPEVLRPGEETEVTAVLTNGCEEQVTVQGADSCSEKGLVAGVVEGEIRHRLQDGGAGSLACWTYLPPAIDLQPQERLEESWTWNGTAWAEDRFHPAPEGPNRLEAWILNIEGVRGQETVTIVA